MAEKRATLERIGSHYVLVRDADAYASAVDQLAQAELALQQAVSVLKVRKEQYEDALKTAATRESMLLSTRVAIEERAREAALAAALVESRDLLLAGAPPSVEDSGGAAS